MLLQPVEYTWQGTGIALRPYQIKPLAAIYDSIINHHGLTIVVVFSRQSGKDELLIHLKIHLLDLFSNLPVGIVEVNPTWKPQTLTAMTRFDQALALNAFTRRRWRKKAGFMRTIGQARVAFMSGQPKASSVGGTANLALFVNEAQDIAPKDYDLKFDPMTASTNATKVFWGTVWTSNTLLAREMRAAREAEKKDGIQRLFIVDADEVGKQLPWYRAYVKARVLKMGRQHPLIKTQLFNEEIDAEGGMFPARRLALMQADRPAQDKPIPGHVYAFVIDVAGTDEAVLELEGTSNPGRDSETLGIIDVDLSTLDTLQFPTYRNVHRRAWTGESHVQVFGQIKALADIWQPMYIVIDATGVGEGQYSLLNRAFPTRVIPIKFTAQEKSEIGYAYIAVIETGRFRDCAPNDTVRVQYEKCQSEILPGPQKLMRWGVPDGTRDKGGTEELVHDDFVLSDALVSALDKLGWSITFDTTIIQAPDVLEEMDRKY